MVGTNSSHFFIHYAILYSTWNCFLYDFLFQEEEITVTDIDATIKANNKVIFDFYANWCQPCKAMEPILENIEETTDIKVVKINVETEEELTQLFGVNSIPAMFFYKDGERVSEKTGMQSEELIIDLFA